MVHFPNTKLECTCVHGLRGVTGSRSWGLEGYRFVRGCCSESSERGVLKDQKCLRHMDNRERERYFQIVPSLGPVSQKLRSELKGDILDGICSDTEELDWGCS